jgi:hypothetical protein
MTMLEKAKNWVQLLSSVKVSPTRLFNTILKSSLSSVGGIVQGHWQTKSATNQHCYAGKGKAFLN